MAYDAAFFALYKVYLGETLVRSTHDAMFDMLFSHLSPAKPRILDLGCGVGELVNFYPAKDYAYYGVDVESHGPHCSAELDYTSDDLYRLLPQTPFRPNCFVSLFSAECCLSANAKYELYGNFFADWPTITCGLVSGFYYRNRVAQVKVAEAGGIESYQTIERATDYGSSLFTEFRCEMAVPSRMFGDDVVEVWKLLERRR